MVSAVKLVAERQKGRRKSPAGVATNDLIVSAYQGTNDAVFPVTDLRLVSPVARNEDQPRLVS